MGQTEAEKYLRRLTKRHVSIFILWGLLGAGLLCFSGELRRSQKASNDRSVQNISKFVDESKLFLQLVAEHPLESRTPAQQQQLDALLADENMLNSQQLQLASQTFASARRGQFVDVLQFWILVVGGVGVIVLSERRRRLKKRIASGLCFNCGYDLRGSPDRCPECGTPR
jgi:hypothetical protein